MPLIFVTCAHTKKLVHNCAHNLVLYKDLIAKVTPVPALDALQDRQDDNSNGWLTDTPRMFAAMRVISSAMCNG